MPKRKNLSAGTKLIEWNPGVANEKQKQFFNSKTLYTAYGGAKGGGKSWAVRVLAGYGAFRYEGIRILILRATYNELEQNHILPMQKLIPSELYSYNGTSHIMTFYNGSTIKFGHWSGEQSEQEYQGIEYDWIFIDEATQFTERTFNYLGGCLRGVSNIPKRMYLTCNPGGVGHRWVKRLFIDKRYKTNCENPEENENPDDYTFIFATVEDNFAIMNGSPTYLRQLASMPENVRRAYRYGDWEAIGGNYFPELSEATHVRKPFKIPNNWIIYRSFDYGLDMFAAHWYAVDTDGRAWCFREFNEKGLIVQEAAARLRDHTLPVERVSATYAPPDMWNRQKDTGKTMAELFMLNHVGIIKAENNRVQGHMMIKDMLAPMPLNDSYVKQLYSQNGEQPPKMLPGLMFFSNCENTIKDLIDIQADEVNPNDCAKEPHDLTHNVDSIRYFCVSRVIRAEEERGEQEQDHDYGMSYEKYMCGGAVTANYIMH